MFSHPASCCRARVCLCVSAADSVQWGNECSAPTRESIHKPSPLHLKNQYVQLPSLLLLKHSQTGPWAQCRTHGSWNVWGASSAFVAYVNQPTFHKTATTFNPLNYVSAPVLIFVYRAPLVFSPPVPYLLICFCVHEVKAHQHLKVQKAIQRLEDSHKTAVTEKQDTETFALIQRCCDSLWGLFVIFCVCWQMLCIIFCYFACILQMFYTY